MKTKQLTSFLLDLSLSMGALKKRLSDLEENFTSKKTSDTNLISIENKFEKELNECYSYFETRFSAIEEMLIQILESEKKENEKNSINILNQKSDEILLNQNRL